jgi:hypothetical protein
MNTPKASTTPPAIRWPTLDRIHRVSALAVNPPITVNTSENPRMNSRMGTTGGRRSWSGASPPATKAR